MKRYARIFRDPVTGAIEHLHTSTAPIEHDVVEVEGVEYEREDLELDAPGERALSARELIDGLRIQNGRPEIDSAKLPDVVIRARHAPQDRTP